jgi:ketosteroid isomerase-like protein
MTGSNSETQKAIAVSDQEAAAMQSGDMNQYLSILSDDAVFMPPNMPAIQGNELRQWLRHFVDGNRVEWPRFEHGETMIADNLALHEYVYTMKVTPKVGGQPAVGYGKGLEVLRREVDGTWKILRNIWNARPADTSAGN